MRAPRPLILVILASIFSGCASPAQRLDEHALGLGFRRQLLQGEGFIHVAYFKDVLEPKGQVLHVYLDGDGTPWVRKRIPAADPTPRNPLMLNLMSLEHVPSVYLGRPCYHGARGNACNQDMWMDRRYSIAVVESMSAALNVVSTGYQSLVLVGYSGGGTLAMLLAERQPKVTTVVTVAANLDTDRWSVMHKQQKLSGSLNPAIRSPLRPGVRQLHYAGAEDNNVPPRLVRDAIAQQPGAKFKVYPNQTHSCCWLDVWPEVLEVLAAD